MESKDLRIGNYVKLKGFDNFYKVSEIYFSGIECNFEEGKKKHFANRIDNFEPIPLTPEILEKAGFERVGRNYQIKHELPTKRIFIVSDTWISGTWQNWAFSLNDENQQIFVALHSLHQLQNLYFALTGEELTINL